MHTCFFLALSAFLFVPATVCVQYSPFVAPNVDQPSNYKGSINLELFRRDTKCGNVCSAMNSEACCPKNTNCAVDGVGNIACCPHNAACTGNLGDGGMASATGAQAAGTGTAAAGPEMTHAISGGSTVANSFYPFPYLPTTYGDAGQCTSSFSSCQLESAKCTGILEGGGMAVTVAGPNGGVTQQGALPVPSAESICSSLSAEACHGLVLAQCSTLGGATKTGGGDFVMGEKANAAPTPCHAGLYGMGVGVVIGLVGQALG